MQERSYAVSTGVKYDRRSEMIAYAYDRANKLISEKIDGVTRANTYDKAGNLLNDGEYTYTYDRQNRLTQKTGTGGTTTYTYDNSGNLISEASPSGTVTYTYNAQDRLIKGEKSTGETSEYVYNALGIRVSNIQTRENQNAGHSNADLDNGSVHIQDYTPALDDDRATWQRTWETEVGTTARNNFETVTKVYVSDYTDAANRDILITENGSFEQRYVYDMDGRRLTAEFSYADGTERGIANIDGDYGENLASDFAVNDIGKVWYRVNMIGTSLYVVDGAYNTVAHAEYDAWGNPLTETYADTNYSGLEELTSYTAYAWDLTLELYFAQNRFYDATEHRFTQQDPSKDGGNWYAYVGDNPLIATDLWGLEIAIEGTNAERNYILEVLQKLTDDKLSLEKENNSSNYVVNITTKASDLNYSTGTGLVRALINDNSQVTIKKTLANKGQNGSFVYTGDSINAFNGKGVAKITVGLDYATSFKPYSIDSADKIKKKDTPNYIALGHELIHAYHYAVGTAIRNENIALSIYKTKNKGEAILYLEKIEELKTVGLSYFPVIVCYDDIGRETGFLFWYRNDLSRDDYGAIVKPDANRITENALRAEHALPLRIEYKSPDEVATIPWNDFIEMFPDFVFPAY